jgi:RimJ/RimL family protein N-acetyltransferase
MARAIQSLVWTTDIDALGVDHELRRCGSYWVVQSPSNPTFWWGNFLLFDDPPGRGDWARWEALFEVENRGRPEVTHRSFAWDQTDGGIGDAEWELVTRGYQLERTAGLLATPDQIRAHERANRDVEVVALDPRPGQDERLWRAAMEVWRQQTPAVEAPAYRLEFLRRRQAELRQLFGQGDRGAWYLALLDGEAVGGLGIVVTGGRARYQTVDTLEAHRDQGVATRLITDAAAHAAANHDIDHLVIAADPDHHAIRIYESVGFKQSELVVGALRAPGRATSGRACRARTGP